MRKFESLALVCNILLALACGGDSEDDGDTGGGGGTGGGTSSELDTGLPETTRIEALTPQQFVSACESLREGLTARLGPDVTTPGVCEVYGAAAIDDPGMCRSVANACVTQVNNGTFMFFSREDLDFTNVECSSDTSQLSGCTATAGELEVCIRDRVAGIEQLLADNDCDHAASVDADDAAQLLDDINVQPASCTSLQTRCPGLDLAAPAP